MWNRSVLALAVASAGIGAPAWGAVSATQALATLTQEKAITNVYRAYFPDLDTARKAAISFHDTLMEANYSKGYLILELSQEDRERLLNFGFTFAPAADFIERRNRFLSQAQAYHRRVLQGETVEPAAIQSIPGYACYETVEETFAAAEAMVASHPTLASWVDVGDSWEKTQGLGGYDIFVLVLTNTQITGDKPKLLINSAIHAREYTTAPLNLAFARWLVDGYGTNADATWILDHHEIHLMLQTNPDGRKRAEAGSSWRKNTNQNYCGAGSSSRGADLNRNFSFKWNSTGGRGSSGSACSGTYRGPFPASEPEVQALEAYVRSLWPDARGEGDRDPAPETTSGIHIDVHSFSELVLWPYGDTNQPAPNGIALQTLGRKFAFFNGYTPQQSIGLYPTDGTSDNVSYGELGVAAYTFELGTSFFQNCSTFTNTILPDNLEALVYAAKVVRTPYITPGGPDVTSLALGGAASTTGVPAGTVVTLSGSATDVRFRNSNGSEPTQNITAAEVYIDRPPWLAGASALSLEAADGAFDGKTESLVGSLDTTGWAEGSYLVYVRAQDATGTWGPFSSVFLAIDNTPVPPPPPDVCLYRATFETGSDGWTGGASTCTTGDFVPGSPTAFSSGNTVTQVDGAAEGTGALFTAPNTSIGADDVDGGTCETVSPVVDAGGEAQVEIALSYFHGQRDAGDDSADGFTIEVLNNGSVVETLVSIGDVTESAAWTTATATVVNPGTLQLRVRATDGSAGGDIVEGGIDNVSICPADGPAPPPLPTCTVSEGFEAGAGGWVNDATATCTAGDFVVGTPTAQTNGGVTTQVAGANSGTGAFFTGVNTTVGSDDVDGGACVARSPIYAVAEASTLSVAYFHGQRDGGDDRADAFALEMSVDGGTTFSVLASNGDTSVSAAWSSVTADVPSGSEVMVRMRCADGIADGDLVECGLDDLAICPIAF